MKKTGIIVIIALIAILFLWGMGGYNGLVNSQENVKSQWGNVENQYQRRADLIPNLVETVKGYATHEKSTFEEVIAARAKATQITVDPTNLTPEKLQEFQAAQGQLSSALGRLIAVAENYPDLKANQNFLELQAQLEGTENRISVERNKFNEMAKEYDVAIRRFPKNIIAGIFNFNNIPYFAAEKGAEKAPSVKF
ncbi:MAG TPA: LemA family protein [Paludibacteraceae bacterium]|jgi:LemA protein|nr:LemA family protein [Paludibacteraceae bacterium]HPS10784.1 LemA family protein [Paludibacteraceae bacterium]